MVHSELQIINDSIYYDICFGINDKVRHDLKPLEFKTESTTNGTYIKSIDLIFTHCVKLLKCGRRGKI